MCHSQNILLVIVKIIVDTSIMSSWLNWTDTGPVFHSKYEHKDVVHEIHFFQNPFCGMDARMNPEPNSVKETPKKG